MPSGEPLGAICVQRFDDSRNSAIHTTYRISLRSSSLQEPRYPLLRVVIRFRLRRISPSTFVFRLGVSWGAYFLIIKGVPFSSSHSREEEKGERGQLRVANTTKS